MSKSDSTCTDNEKEKARRRGAGIPAHSKGNKCAEDRVPGRLPHHGATVERGLNFPWFNWARNHFRCNTRADAAATSSNHRKSSTSLSLHSLLSSSALSLSLSCSPLFHCIEETTEFPILAWRSLLFVIAYYVYSRCISCD